MPASAAAFSTVSPSSHPGVPRFWTCPKGTVKKQEKHIGEEGGDTLMEGGPAEGVGVSEMGDMMYDTLPLLINPGAYHM